MKTYFITGTDTGCGKTTLTVALARDLVARGRSVVCYKPVASGCEMTAQGLRNDDALKLQAAASVSLDYEQVNPVALEPAIAPHIAAERAGVAIDVARLVRAMRAPAADVRLIEGAGGWMVPLGPEAMTADLARSVEARVVLVIGIRLGCINHSLLSARAIQDDRLALHGWIANIMDPTLPALDENLETLERHLGPMLARYDSADGLIWT